MSAGSGGGPVRYGGWTPDGRGWFAGVSGFGWTAIAAGGLPVLAAAAARAWLLTAGLLPLWAVLVAAVAVPVRSRPAAGWVRDLLLRLVGVAAGWSDWQSRAAAGDPGDLTVADLPGVLAGIRTHDGPPWGAALLRPAVIADHAARTWAVVARIGHPGIGLAETPARDRLGRGLAELLDAAATGGLVSMIALQIRTVPDDGITRQQWRSEHLDPGAPGLARQVEAEMAAAVGQVGMRREAFVTVVVPEDRLARPGREAGGGIDGRARALYGALQSIQAGLLGPVGATEVTWLDSPALAAVIRTGFAPTTTAPDTQATGAPAGEPTVGAVGVVPMAAAGPSSTPAPGRRWYAHDGWASVTCTVLLPDKGAVMGALAPVLAPAEAGERRCCTVFFQPLPAATAGRLVGSESMSAELAGELRRRSGFRTRAVHHRDAEQIQRQDTRLAQGSTLVRVAVAAASTVPADRPIAEAGRRLEADITAAGFHPLRLDLAQDSGFAAACIPLGVGLPRRRGTR